MMRPWMSAILPTSMLSPDRRKRTKLGMRKTAIESRVVTMVWFTMMRVASVLLFASQQQNVQTIIITPSKTLAQGRKMRIVNGCLDGQSGGGLQYRLIQIKTTAMICNNLKTTLATMIRIALLTPLSRCFSKLSTQLQSAPYRSYQCRSSNMRFRGSEHSLIPYFSHPAIETKSIPTEKYYEIGESPVLTLNFVPQASEEMMKQAWENRKNIGLSFRAVLQLTKVNPISKEQCNFRQGVYTQEITGKTLTKCLKVAALAEKGAVEMTLWQISLNNFTKEEDINWEVSVQLKNEDYVAFVHSIRNNLLYISGAMYGLQVTKQESLIEFDNCSFVRQQTHPFDRQPKQKTNKSTSKQSKIVKKQKK